MLFDEATEYLYVYLYVLNGSFPRFLRNGQRNLFDVVTM